MSALPMPEKNKLRKCRSYARRFVAMSLVDASARYRDDMMHRVGHHAQRLMRSFAGRSMLREGAVRFAAVGLLMACVVVAASPAMAQSARISCPLRVVTKAGTLVASPQTAGFRESFDENNSMAFLMGVDLYAGSPETAARLKPSATQKGQITWNVDGQKAEVGCRYESGVVLTQAVAAAAKTCTAVVKAGRGPDGEPWNLESAVVTCR